MHAVGRAGQRDHAAADTGGTRAAGLGHAVACLVDALRQGGELLLRGSELRACFGPSLDRSAVFDARGTELCLDLLQLATSVTDDGLSLQMTCDHKSMLLRARVPRPDLAVVRSVELPGARLESDGSLLLQSAAFAEGREAGAWVKRFKQEGAAVLTAEAPVSIADGIDRAVVEAALAALVAAEE